MIGYLIFFKNIHKERKQRNENREFDLDLNTPQAGDDIVKIVGFEDYQLKKLNNTYRVAPHVLKPFT
jgi:hypothetical protein